MFDKTMTFSVNDERELEMKKTLTLVYDALVQKGYNPVRQPLPCTSLQKHRKKAERLPLLT